MDKIRTCSNNHREISYVGAGKEGCPLCNANKKKDIIEIESDKLSKTLESTSLRIAVLACQKYLIKQGYQVIRIT